ncbi:MAG: Hsp20/alpha crystallin family protein [Alphaproteobacteria bacterium]|nr:Hsp20/alpha crystallin family protein [Alphaproteobacteria bacterium]MCB9696594.1 Hsp20/alpha crystallin family protein [Alphaproteobacteria bacterium]
MSLFDEMETLSRTVDRMLARHGLDGGHGLLRTWAQAEDDVVADREDAWLVSVDLPGFQREDVNITVENGLLTLRATRDNALPEGTRLVHRERRAVDLTRTWRVPQAADAEAITAELADGVLTLTLPKRAEQRPRQIEIRA